MKFVGNRVLPVYDTAAKIHIKTTSYTTQLNIGLIHLNGCVTCDAVFDQAGNTKFNEVYPHPLCTLQ